MALAGDWELKSLPTEHLNLLARLGFFTPSGRPHVCMALEVRRSSCVEAYTAQSHGAEQWDYPDLPKPLKKGIYPNS